MKLTCLKTGKFLIEWKDRLISIQLPPGVHLRSVRCGMDEARIVRQNVVYAKVLHSFGGPRPAGGYPAGGES